MPTQKMNVTITTQRQEALPELGRDAKTIHYIIIGEGDDKIIITSGESTTKKIMAIMNKKPTETKK